MSQNPDYGPCWSCQRKITRRSAVYLTSDAVISVCRKCWALIPPESRVSLAIRFHDRSDAGLGVEETLSLIRDLIANSISGYFNKFEDPRGRLN